MSETGLEGELAGLRERVERLRRAIGERFLGHGEAVELLLASLLAGGHVLLEGAPGLGKTTLARQLALALELRFGRVQFTPDLMPADILGARILEESASGTSFRFDEGPVFTHVLLADEINRATPRTQSALLEAMAEHQVTVFGETRALEEPFFVVATQNPIEMEGTYPLPEAQVDRFLCKVELSGPNEEELLEILRATGGPPPEKTTEPVFTRAELLQARSLTRQVEASSEILERISRLVVATDPRTEHAPDGIRRHLRFGASPRGAQALLWLAKARAILHGRPWVSDEDVELLAAPALRHRLVFGYEGEASGVHPDELVAEALARSSA